MKRLMKIAHYQQCSHYDGMVPSWFCSVEWERPSWLLNLSVAIQLKHTGFTSSFKPSREIASFIVFTHCQTHFLNFKASLAKCNSHSCVLSEVTIQRDHVENIDN